MASSGNSVETPTLAQVLQSAIKNQILDLHTCLPAKVLSYDKDTQKANLQPLLRKKYIVAGVTDIPVLNSVPVQWPSSSGGKAFLHLPLAEGDTGIVVFAERSIDDWLSGDGSVVTPTTSRTHDLSDGVFIPGVRPFDVALKNIPEDNAVLQNDQLRIELDPSGKISITGPSAELISVLSSAFGNISSAIGNTASATVIITGGSSAGTFPLDPTTVAALTADQAALDSDIDDLNTLKI